MGPASATVSELPFELFSVISAHLPLAYRPSTLLSLALTCHRFYEVVIPDLLYNAVRIMGEDRAIQTLNTLIAKAAPVNEEDIQKKGNPSPSHCIRHLCIESSIFDSDESPIAPSFGSGLPMSTLDAINALQKLIDMDGLRHLSDLTLHIDSRSKYFPGTRQTRLFPSFSLFLECLRKKCPHLKNVYLTDPDLSHEFENKWIEHELFSIKVYNRL
jgi:hypothetical protein